MSNAAITKTWALKTQSPVLKAVMICLADMANDQGQCFPCIATICDRTEYSRSCVQKTLSKLERAGLLERDFRSNRSTMYRLTYCDQPPDDRRQGHPTEAGGHPTEAHNPKRTLSKKGSVSLKEKRTAEPSLEVLGKQGPPPERSSQAELFEKGIWLLTTKEKISVGAARSFLAMLAKKVGTLRARNAVYDAWGRQIERPREWLAKFAQAVPEEPAVPAEVTRAIEEVFGYTPGGLAREREEFQRRKRERAEFREWQERQQPAQGEEW